MINQKNRFAEFPTIGENVEEFTKCFGEPLKENSENSMMNRYQIDVEGASYLIALKFDGDVYNISFSLKVEEVSNEHGVSLFADQLIPIDAKLVKKVEKKVIPLVNADEPISIFEYYSESVKDSNGYYDGKDRGYITKYLAVNDGVASFTVALGKEPLIQ